MNDLLVEITHCQLLENSKSGSIGPCSRIVGVQRHLALDEHQVPEPWTGHLDEARILFISSNPSIDFNEPYPSWGDDLEATNEFFTNRFGNQPGQIKDGMYPTAKDGSRGRAVRFWSGVRQRAFELLPDAEPGLDYAMTEVVHCKSRKEVGVRDALSTCTQRYMPRIIDGAPKAKLLVVFGVHAARSMAEVFALELDSTRRLARMTQGGLERTVVYLDHPASGGKAKRFETALSTADLETIRRDLATS